MTVKKLIFLLALSLSTTTSFTQAKVNSYDHSWKKIDSLINKNGQPKTALAELNALYTRAKKENNDAQLIKTLIYQANLNEQLADNDKNETFPTLQKEINETTQPAKSILQSILASSYQAYLQRNRYKLYNRTNTVNFINEDPATWSAGELNEKISSLYLASISYASSLQRATLASFDAIITEGNTRALRPTLFDLLAHRALDYFKNNQTDTALSVFNQLETFHAEDSKPDALIDVSIEKIQFQYAKGDAENKDEQYKTALESVINKYPANAMAAQAIYLLADFYTQKAQLFDPLQDTANRYAYLETKKLCERALQLKDSSEGKANCFNLLKQISQLELKTEVEQVNVPGQPFRMLITYRNTPTAYFRIVKIDAAMKQRLNSDTYSDIFWQQLLAIQPINSFQNNLPDTKDYQAHRVEVKADPLPIGAYALIGSAGKGFELKDNMLSLQYFYVSNIAYVNKENNYYVLDRQTGAPLPKAYIQVWKRQYDYQQKRNRIYKDAHYTADMNGYVKITDTPDAFRNYAKLLDITYGKDKLFIDEEIYNYVYNGYKDSGKIKSQAFLFTDRSIYRPGQLVYFKGIVISRDPLDKAVASVNHNSIVKLYDANEQVIDSLALTTNEYGSYSGKFTLPSGQLNGTFSIKDEGTETRMPFRVEEYKRPKFTVDMKQPGGTYHLQDTVQVEGLAKSFAGNNIDGAPVNYRVTRKMALPLLFRSYVKIWPPYRGNEVEIAHGTTKTDADGKFTVSFKAIPDKTISRGQDVSFDYEVTATTTDINGETRSGAINVAVGYKALKIIIAVPDLLHTDSLKTIDISTTNMNDIAEKAMVNITINKLSAPVRIFRKRYWQQPDQFIQSRDEFYTNFLYDPYSNEDDVSKWPVEKKFFETSVTTVSDSGAVAIPGWHSGPFSPANIKGARPEPGWYMIVASAKDKFNNEVKDIRYIQLYNDKIVSPGPMAIIETNRSTAEPGDKVSYSLKTNVDSIFAVHEVIRTSNKSDISISRMPLANHINLTEADRGQIIINIFFVKNNRVYARQQEIDIPYVNKHLKIDYTTFRNRTLPGTNEKWKVKISGYKGERLASELLTSMYDASLDQFNPHAWSIPYLWNESADNTAWTGEANFKKTDSYEKSFQDITSQSFPKEYDRLLVTAGLSSSFSNRFSDVVVTAFGVKKQATMESRAAVPQAATLAKDEALAQPNEPAVQEISGPQPRQNLNETAFFLPGLHTDSSGNVEFSFTTPEALTTWKWMLLAHTRNLAFGYKERKMITQKELMVQPNAPRFLREGDLIDLSAKVVNMTDKETSGSVVLQLTNASTGKNVDALFANKLSGKSFSIQAGQSVAIAFRISVPENFADPVTWRIVATAGSLSDGEEAVLPVISNRMEVTETLPLPFKGGGAKNFSFNKLLNSGSSKSLVQKGITIEFTSNPAWYAVQALPYLTEGEKENAEQLFNRYYANALASKIAGSSARFKQIMEQWKASDTAALLSNLQKNEALKSVLLQETPWVLEAKTEAQQKKNIALLFDMNRMSSESAAALHKLTEMQSPTGGFVWLKGAPEDRYMTQYILTGIGHLKQLGAISTPDKTLETLIRSGLSYLDNQIKKDYQDLTKANKTLPVGDIDNITSQYLYMRSFFTDVGIPGDVFSAYNYYRNQSKKAWLKKNSFVKGMIALSLFRTGDKQNAANILRSLNETRIANEELGSSWKDVTNGYYWYEAPIEAQSLLIEAFSEISKDSLVIDDMKTWLLKNKQTNNWKTSKATADACYALLLRGSDWTSGAPSVEINLGNKKIAAKETEAGTGYFKQSIPAHEVTPSMGNISVKVTPPENVPSQASWGSVYWQYSEDLDKITPAITPLRLNKKLFIEKNTAGGPVLEPLPAGNTVHTGDKIRVRIELRSDRTMEYVHMKDMRASCMEPVNVLSEYKWQGGLGYFESTRDASTDFFFGVLPKGVYVFEYSLFVSASGSFSNGITSIQCMYAPEFSSHSEGITLQSENR